MCRLVYILPTLNPEAWFRLHAAVVGAPERIDDRGMKGIFGEYVVCLARFRLRAAEIGGFLFVF